MRRIGIGVALILVLGWLVEPALAQSTATGTLTGTAKDPNGGPLPGATVTAVQTQTGLSRNTETGSLGEWTLPTLPVGEYTLTFEVDGFKKLVRQGVMVEAGVPRSVNATLEVGGVAESVTVTTTVELLTPTVAATFRRPQLDELTAMPMTTRSFTHLLSSEAGVSAELPPVMVNGTGQHLALGERHADDQHQPVLQRHRRDEHHVERRLALRQHRAGARDAAGSQAADEPLRRQRPAGPAAGTSSSSPGAAATLFGGTRVLHVPARSASTLNDFFFDKEGIEKPKARRDEGGFTLGGPVKRNRVFFFGGYQRTTGRHRLRADGQQHHRAAGSARLIQGARTRNAARRLLGSSIRASRRRFRTRSAARGSRASTTSRSRCSTLRNPVTGDYVIPAPREGPDIGSDAIRARPRPARWAATRSSASATSCRPVQAGPVHPARRRALSGRHRLSIDGFFADFPALDPFPDPFEPGLAVHAAPRRPEHHARDLRHDDVRATKVNELRAGFFTLNNSRRLDDPSSRRTNASVGVPNPANIFDQPDATTRLGHYVGRPGSIMERFSFGGPNDTFNRREPAARSPSATR